MVKDIIKVKLNPCPHHAKNGTSARCEVEGILWLFEVYNYVYGAQ